MDNMEENSRSTEQDRVANPVEETVSTTVEPALSENKRERKKREKAEKKKNAPAQGNSLLGSTLAKIMAFVLMIAAAIAGVLGLYGTCMLADSGAYSSGNLLNLFFCHFLKGSMTVPTHLTEGVILIAGIYGHYYGKQRGK